MFCIDHIGVAVTDLEAAVERWCRLLGVDRDAVEYRKVEHARMTLAYLTGSGAKIELMAPWDEESTIAKFIAKRGAGIHHICISTGDIEGKWDELAIAGFPAVDERPRDSLGEKIAFLHPKGLDGVLVEWKES